MDNVIYTGIMFALTLAGFMFGKYVFPKIPQNVKDTLEGLSKMAADFVVWAKEFMKSSSGEEKMEAVVQKLKEVAEQYGWTVTEDQLKAIVQNAYNAMKAGEAAQAAATQLEAVTVPTAPAATVIINTSAAEKVAVATDNVPEDALKHNADGSVNVYDENGNKTGTMTEAEAEAAASGVESVVAE